MKTIFTLLMLPVIAFFAAYTLVMTWFLSLTLWINEASRLLNRQRA
jgi:hypothetical protein